MLLYTPAIRVSGVDRRPDTIAVIAEEKEKIFIEQGFLSQTRVKEETAFLDSVADVSAKEIREALFAQSVKKAPGVDSIGFKALRLLWRWAEDRVVSLV